jgi:transcriptional regulator with XRE-family HTH domain
MCPIVRKSTFSPEYDLFCSLLRQVRMEAGLSQRQLALRLNVPQAWLSKCESGQRRLDVLELMRICEAIGVSADSFVARLQLALEAHAARR